MTFRRCALLCFALVLATPAVAADTGHFVLMLGNDTTSVESFTRTPARLVVDQIGRSPRVMRRHFVYDYTQGDLSHFSMVATPVGDSVPTQTIEATLGPDSIASEVRTAGRPPSRTSIAAPKGTLLVPLSSRWPGYETQIMKMVQGKTDSLHGGELYLGGTDVIPFGIVKLGKDSVEFHNEAGDLFHARVDREGHVLGVLPIHSTGRFSVTRVASLDLEATARRYLAVDKAGGGIGVLSPRDTAKAADDAGTWLWIDYGRPSVRGRTIFGQVVPYGEVWRTGANAATQLKTERTLVFNGKVVPPGFYSLWTVPSPTGWKLIINSETGQWGTEHKAEKDILTIDMTTTSLPQSIETFTIGVMVAPSGEGALSMDWDRTRAITYFNVKP